MMFSVRTIRTLKFKEKEDILAANVTERYGVISGAAKESLLKSLGDGSPVPVIVGNEKKIVEAKVVSMTCSTNARRFYAVVFEGEFWQGKTRRVTVKNYDTDGSVGGEGICEYVKPDSAY